MIPNIKSQSPRFQDIAKDIFAGPVHGSIHLLVFLTALFLTLVLRLIIKNFLVIATLTGIGTSIGLQAADYWLFDRLDALFMIAIIVVTFLAAFYSLGICLVIRKIEKIRRKYVLPGP